VVGAKRRPGGAGKAGRTHLFDHSIQLISNSQVIEPKRQQTLARQDCVADAILSRAIRGGMRTAVNLDDDPARPAKEIQKVATHWSLPAEMQTIPTETTQRHPQPCLGRSERLSHRAGFGDDRHEA
jgi:hypothetical protein